MSCTVSHRLISVYILAIPVFSFFLPLYSFWKMDDFSWGSTRLGEYNSSTVIGCPVSRLADCAVVGDKGKKIVIHDEGK
ncbi:MAG: hypothetical protein EOO38_32760, partial [Cytophagaceae bacterium]